MKNFPQLVRYISLAAFFVAVTCHADPKLKVASPNSKYQLLIEEKEYDGEIRTVFSIGDAHGNLIQDVGATEYSISGVKWHKSSNCVMVLESIAHQDVMKLITLEGKVWKSREVGQFGKKGPYDFRLVNAACTQTSFICYYFGSASREEGWNAYCTEVKIATGEAKVKSTKRIKDEELPFYRPAIGKVFYMMKKVEANAPLHFQSSLDDNEPEWFGVPGA